MSAIENWSPRNELSSGKLAIEKLHEFQGLRLVDLAPFGNLRNFPVLHGRMNVAEGGGDGAEQVELDPALPHLDRRLADGSPAEQRRRGLQLLEIAADRHGFTKDRAVVELKLREATISPLCSNAPMSTGTSGTVMPFSARKMRVRRGFGARPPSNSFIAFLPQSASRRSIPN
jgi:hypothetical protein